jgi:hypothetical protein
MRSAVSGITSQAARAALLATSDVIIELREHNPGQSPIDHAIDRLKGLLIASTAVTFGMGALVGALAAWIARSRSRRGPGGPSITPGPSDPRLDRTALRAS